MRGTLPKRGIRIAEVMNPMQWRSCGTPIYPSLLAAPHNVIMCHSELQSGGRGWYHHPLALVPRAEASQAHLSSDALTLATITRAPIQAGS